MTVDILAMIPPTGVDCQQSATPVEQTATVRLFSRTRMPDFPRAPAPATCGYCRVRMSRVASAKFPHHPRSNPLRRSSKMTPASSLRWLGRASAALVLVAFAALPALAQKTQLTVYTALEDDQLKAYTEGFNKVNPDIEIVWVRDSTGIITAKLLAEKANPKADVIMGVAATSMAIFDKEGMLQPYAPQGLARIAPQYRDAKNPPAWTGMDVWGATICFNTVEAARRGIPKPETWKDLTKPIYKGQIVMPHPASSGTGYFDVTAWLQMFGEA